MLLKFFWYTALTGLVIIFCMLNQQVMLIDLYWIRVFAPTHLGLIVFFLLGVIFETLRSMLSRFYQYLFHKKQARP